MRLTEPALARRDARRPDGLDERVAAALDHHYTRIEIVAAVGYSTPGKKNGVPQGGILMLKDEKRELLFVTLDKSAKSFSPTTRGATRHLSRHLPLGEPRRREHEAPERPPLHRERDERLAVLTVCVGLALTP